LDQLFGYVSLRYDKRQNFHLDVFEFEIICQNIFDVKSIYLTDLNWHDFSLILTLVWHDVTTLTRHMAYQPVRLLKIHLSFYDITITNTHIQA
jgi:hypothetical protein